jgi:PKD repeat protein
MKKYGSYLKKPFTCVFFLALMLISVTAFGATIRVPAYYSTIQAGIDAATNGDTVLVANGTYTGAGNKNLDFKGKAITVRSENGPEHTVIDCEGDGRGFSFHSGEIQSSVLDGLTIINGRADYGGGILCSSSSPTIINCRIIGNEAERAGGGIYCDFRCTITNCNIAGNTAVWGGGIGIVDAFGPVKVTNCTITGNTASFGSVMDISDSNATITNCILWGGKIRIALGPSRISQFKYCDIEDDKITHPTIIHSDPRFVDVSDPDPVNWDLHLQSSSPCIDTGTSNGAPDHDIDGDSRPQGAGYDMGADEYDGNHRPVAHFSASPTSGAAPLTVNFTDQSTGQITSWSWDFGDGSISTEQNPSHTYTDDGSYTVSLTVTGPGGSDTETKADYIKVGSPSPVADFSASPIKGPPPLIVNFIDQSTGQITSWSWDFGDGSISTEQNPSHTYTDDGSYTVSLTVTGPGGSDTETKADYINVIRGKAMPWISLLLFGDDSQVPQAKLSIRYEPNPVPVYTGNSPCFSGTEWHYFIYVSETAGVGLTVDRWTADFYDQIGDHISQVERSSSDFADRFDDCGPGSANIAPNSTVCWHVCATLGDRPSGSIVYAFYGTDTNGDSVSESARVHFSAAAASSTSLEKKGYSLPRVKSR